MRNKKTLFAILWNILILVFCLINLSNIDGVQKVAFPHIDKVVHFIFYTASAFLWSWALDKNSRRYRTNQMLIVMGLIFFGISVEFLQDLLPTKRSFEWLDILCNTAGVIVGTVVYMLTEKVIQTK